MAPRRALAVAAEAGTVKFWTTSARAGCMLYLYGASGTTYLYIHLNNDLTRRNDNKGRLRPGRRVRDGAEERRAGRARGSRSATSATRATRTGSTRTSTSRCTRTAARRSSPYPYLRKARGCSSRPSGHDVHARADGHGRRPPARISSSARPGALVAGRPQDRAGRPEGRRGRARDGVARGVAAAGLRVPRARAPDAGPAGDGLDEPAKVTLPAQAGAKGALRPPASS